jgi:hypothetical protein
MVGDVEIFELTEVYIQDIIQ